MASPTPTPTPTPKPNILILCTGNSCRSHMGEGLLRASAAGALVNVHSAGSKPAGYVHPLAVQVMSEIGIDISGHTSKHMDLFLGVAKTPTKPTVSETLAELRIGEEGEVKSEDAAGEESRVKVEVQVEGSITTVITVCGNADQVCPFFPGQLNRYHWGFDDPAHAVGSEEEVLAEFRRVRDQMKLVFEAYGAGLREGSRI